jgi:predicted phage terminase large subunit-like protein
MELSRESLEIFYAAFMKGDGHRNRKTGAHGVSLACEGLIDDIQEIASKLGLRSTRRAITVAGKYKAWRLSVHGRQRKLIACPSNFTQERYVGPVHCLTVPATGTFLCRYRGQVFWSGNSESQYTFLFTRLRRARTGELGKVPLRMRSASNPGSSGHLWVFNRFVNDDTRHEGVVYVPSRMQDNPSTDIEEYKESLKNVDPITRRQMEEGDWSAVEGGRFKREWFNRRWRWDANGLDIVLEDNRGPYKFRLAGAPLFVSCDPASSSKTSADFTVFGVWANTPRGDLVWVDCIRRQVDIPDQPKLLEEVYRKHRFKAIGIEAVASNQSMFQFAQRMMLPAVRLTPKGQDKLAHAQQAMILAEQGMVWLPCPSANPTFPFDEVLAELTLFTGTKADRNDDVADALSYGCDMRLKMKYMSGGAAESPGSFNPLTRQRW